MHWKKIIGIGLLAGGCAWAHAQTQPADTELKSFTCAKHEQRIVNRRAAAEEKTDGPLEQAWRNGKKTLQKIGLEAGVTFRTWHSA